jgi:hypothetical protein
MFYQLSILFARMFIGSDKHVISGDIATVVLGLLTNFCEKVEWNTAASREDGGSYTLCRLVCHETSCPCLGTDLIHTYDSDNCL